MEQIWLEVSIDTTAAGIEPVCAYLTALGVGGLVVEEEADFEQFADENKSCWDEVDEALKQARTGTNRVKCYLTDDEDGLRRTADFIRSLNTVQRVEVLPYHTLGLFKWQKLGIPYPLPDAVPPTPEQVKRAEELLQVQRYPD